MRKHTHKLTHFFSCKIISDFKEYDDIDYDEDYEDDEDYNEAYDDESPRKHEELWIITYNCELSTIKYFILYFLRYYY